MPDTSAIFEMSTSFAASPSYSCTHRYSAAAATDAGCFSEVCPSESRSFRNAPTTAVASLRNSKFAKPRLPQKRFTSFSGVIICSIICVFKPSIALTTCL